MKQPDLIAELRARDIRLRADGDQLQCDAPAGALTPELRSRLLQARSEILDWLRAPMDLSFPQQRLWFLDQLQPGGTPYVITEAFEMRGALDVPLLEQALAALVRRHDSLRTVFVNIEGRPLQVVLESGPWSLPREELGGGPDARRRLQQRLRELSLRPFDLASGPLFRAHLLGLGSDTHILLFVMHHIITDGWSIGILLSELAKTYGRLAQSDQALPAPARQYRDFVAWQRDWMRSQESEAQLSFWKSRLQGAPHILELPTDRPRPAVESHRGAVHSFMLPLALSEALCELARNERATLFVTLLSGFIVLLSRYSGQQDLLVGTPAANRSLPEFESILGFFANTLVVRANLADNPTVSQFLARMQQVCLEAVAHQDLPWDRLVQEINPERTLSRSPVFQVLFALQNAPVRAAEFPGLSLVPLDVHAGGAQFDLTLIFEETTESLRGKFEYATDLFDASTIAGMAVHLETLLRVMSTEPGQSVRELPLLTPPERQ